MIEVTIRLTGETLPETLQQLDALGLAAAKQSDSPTAAAPETAGQAELIEAPAQEARQEEIAAPDVGQSTSGREAEKDAAEGGEAGEAEQPPKEEGETSPRIAKTTVRAALAELRLAGGPPPGELMRKYGASALSNLKETHYGDLLADVTAELKKLKEKK